jgi:hypothetical protein
MRELLPLTAADCASATSETTSEIPKKTPIHLAGPRWSSRAYPRKDAVLNPRPHPLGRSQRYVGNWVFDDCM